MNTSFVAIVDSLKLHLGTVETQRDDLRRQAENFGREMHRVESAIRALNGQAPAAYRPDNEGGTATLSREEVATVLARALRSQGPTSESDLRVLLVSEARKAGRSCKGLH